MSDPQWAERVPAAPFVAWLCGELAKVDGDDAPVKVLAGRLGVTERTLYRFSRSLDGEGDPTQDYARATVEDMLDAADVLFADIYPEIAATEDSDLEPDAYCEGCHEVVSPIGGACPWCDRPVSTALPRQRLYCKREDRMVFPAVDGSCWRCGGKLKSQIPRLPCECGCGEIVTRFDHHGRGPIKFLRGHNPRSLEREVMLPVDAFVAYLEREVQAVDPLTAVASKHGLRRDDLVALLRGGESEIERKVVTHALWVARRYGQAKGAPMRSGPGLLDLYPEFGAKRVCPECGGGKAPNAEVCKSCRKKRRSRGQTTLDDLRISELVMQQAKRLRFEEYRTFEAVAAALFGQTPHSTELSLRSTLTQAFKVKGWPTGPLRRRPLPEPLLVRAREAREGGALSFAAAVRVVWRDLSAARPDLSPSQAEHQMQTDFTARGWFTGRLDRDPRRVEAAA